ncbi:complement C1q-like protein 2 [Saccostrea echinata]|uniref:complement C1q-like protein 2 n=1 Tax=Saccostrea echinata TaxID=191078 RepID=UPI002A81CA96|nr:complement C1q-like protein 2 [Saccostrea echinata]
MSFHNVSIFLFVCFCYVDCQNTTNITDQKTLSDLRNRVSLLERAIGKMLTGKENVNITTVNVPRKGLPIFNNTPIVFCARSSSSVSGINTGFILKFPTVNINLGNHYNPTNGIFIAPVHGLYMFHWTMQCYYSGSTHCSTGLRVNDSLKGKIRSGEEASGYYHTGSNTVIVEVEAGSHVWIENESYSNVYINSDSSFAGSLLQIL